MKDKTKLVERIEYDIETLRVCHRRATHEHDKIYFSRKIRTLGRKYIEVTGQPYIVPEAR